ncbi:MAG: hypothetical protein EKK55_02300 [Rhodocyclaceae bacterium]|nr:MAG: hypothetical protein EKK55_02300 [Rhodocyclaceae bacterium]
MERVVKVLAVDLTEAEVHERSVRCTRLVRVACEKALALEATKKRAKAMIEEAAAILDGARAEHDQLARVVGERKEDREVECEERIVRADRRRTLTRLDTGEVLRSDPVSDEEMRRGAKWSPNFEAGRSELRHPEEPEVLLNTRALTDDEKQVPLPNASGEVKATTLKEAAAIAAAREKGDLPSDPSVVSRETLDAVTPVRTAETPSLGSMGIEQEGAKRAKKRAKADPSAEEFEAARDKLAERIKTAATGAGLASAWVDVLGAKLPEAMVSFLAGYWTEAANELHLTPDTLSALRRRGEAPPETFAEQVAGA